MADNKTNRVKIKSMTLIVLELIRKGWTVEVAAKAAEDFYSRIMDEKTKSAKIGRSVKESGAEPLSFDKNGNPACGEVSADPSETEKPISRLRRWIDKLEGDKVYLKDKLEREKQKYDKLLLEKQAIETGLKDAKAKDKDIELLKQHNESLVKGNYGLMQQLYDKDAELTKIYESLNVAESRLKEVAARNESQSVTIKNLNAANARLNADLHDGPYKTDEALNEISTLKAQLAGVEDALQLANKDCTAFAKRFEEDEKTIKKLEKQLREAEKYENEYHSARDKIRQLLRENMSLVAKITATETKMNGPVAPTIDRYENAITREAAEAKKYPKARKKARKEDLNDPADNSELTLPTPVDGDPEQVPVYPKDGNPSSDARDGGPLDTGAPFDSGDPFDNDDDV